MSSPAIILRRLGDFAGAMCHYRRRIGVGSTREELLALQRRRLVETVRRAAAASPLYRELYAKVELSDDLDVRALPVVNKAMLMERFDEWVTDPRLHLPEIKAHLERIRADDLYLGEYRCLASGGTSGRKGVFVYDRDEWREFLSMALRWSEMGGLRPRMPRVRIATVAATSALHGTARLGMSLDLGLHALCRLDARTPLPKLVAALNEHQPEVLTGYASVLSLLAIEQLEGRLRIHPRTVATGAEVRTEEMTANIRSAWGVEAFDAFGTTEGLFGHDCEHHQGIHLFEDLCFVEVVDERGEQVPDGVGGTRLLITNLFKRTQPLLRYELDDMVALTTAPCACGRPLARIVSLKGRSDDILQFDGTDGRTVAVHPLTLRSPMAELPELRQYKIVQDDQGLHVLVALRQSAAADQASQRILAALRTKLLAAGVADPRLDVTISSELPREQGHAAKFKLIESRVSSKSRSSQSQPS